MTKTPRVRVCHWLDRYYLYWIVAVLGAVLYGVLGTTWSLPVCLGWMLTAALVCLVVVMCAVEVVDRDIN